MALPIPINVRPMHTIHSSLHKRLVTCSRGINNNKNLPDIYVILYSQKKLTYGSQDQSKHTYINAFLKAKYTLMIVNTVKDTITHDFNYDKSN